jgi:hypothetical protein
MSFTWIPFFQEWYDRLASYRHKQAELVQLLIQAGVQKGLVDKAGTPLTAIPLTEIDPFTATNAVLKHGDINCSQIFSKIAKELGIKAPLPTDYEGVPRPSSFNFWYFPFKEIRSSTHVPELWDLFETARKGQVTSEQYDNALKLHSVGTASLTQALFRLAPDHFFPVDSQTTPFLKKLGIHPGAETLNDYRHTLEQVQKIGDSYAELSRRAWLEQKKPYEGTMKEGGINQGYIQLGRPGFFEARYYGGNTEAEAGTEFDLLMPDGKSYRTDIRRQGGGGRIRARFSALFKKLGLKPGATFRITRIKEGEYQLTFNEAPLTQAGPEDSATGSGTVKAKSVAHPLNQILFGPPGSGKTHATAQIAVEICDGTAPGTRDLVMERFKNLRKQGRIGFVTFHPSFSYEDFVEGIRLDEATGKLSTRPGIFKELCSLAHKEAAAMSDGGISDPKTYVLVIDEINRGNVSRIFGELITLLEPEKRVSLVDDDVTESIMLTLPYSRESFGVPENVYLVGTMNTADKSIATLDLALRRRFQFVHCPPDVEEINPAPVNGVNLQALLTALNQRIEYLLDRDHLLGHAYFIGIDNLKDLQSVFVGKVIPLLQEYFFDDWNKIALVLKGAGNESAFLIGDIDLDPAVLFGGKAGTALRDVKRSYQVANPETWTAEVFRELYAYLPGQSGKEMVPDADVAAA